jgi:cell division protein FtsL
MNIEWDKVLTSITLSLIGGVVWLVRKVFTNEKQIALLEAEIKRRNEDIKEIKADVKSLIGDK